MFQVDKSWFAANLKCGSLIMFNDDENDTCLCYIIRVEVLVIDKSILFTCCFNYAIKKILFQADRQKP